jgi:hypothetical protein
MHRLVQLLFRRLVKTGPRGNSANTRRPVRLAVENLEERQVMSTMAAAIPMESLVARGCAATPTASTFANTSLLPGDAQAHDINVSRTPDAVAAQVDYFRMLAPSPLTRADNVEGWIPDGKQAAR